MKNQVDELIERLISTGVIVKNEYTSTLHMYTIVGQRDDYLRLQAGNKILFWIGNSLRLSNYSDNWVNFETAFNNLPEKLKEALLYNLDVVL